MGLFHNQKLNAIFSALMGLFSFCMLDFFESRALALPVGGQVKVGQVEIPDVSGSYQQVTQHSDKAIIEWQEFNVGAQEHVHFQTPSTSSTTLNRVVGHNLSTIAGKLSSTGKIILINPNGIVFAQGAEVDVAGLIASTIEITNTDFLNENYVFSQNANAMYGRIINKGSIKVTAGGAIALLAPYVEQAGVVVAQQGSVVLGSAQKVTLDFSGDGLVSFTINEAISAYDEQGNLQTVGIKHTGQTTASGGKVIMSAAVAEHIIDNTVYMGGVVQANSMQYQNGEVVLSGGETGAVNVAGTIQARGDEAGEVGGNVTVTGQHIVLAQTADVDVSGEAGGGTVRIGGDYRGGGSLQHAATTTVVKGAKVSADALTYGNGGTIIAWSGEKTIVHGSLSATGGAEGGNAGLIETSSKQELDVKGIDINLSAAAGDAGLWLIDPATVTIDASYLADNNIIGQLNAGTNINIATDSGAGTITVAAGISWSGTGDLLLDAFGDIIINADITSSGSGSLTLQAANTNSVAEAIQIDAAINMSGTGTLTINASGSDNDVVATANVSTYDFTLTAGDWLQIGGTTSGITAGSLPTFTVKNDFTLTSGSTFQRFSDGVGSAGDPYLMEDAFGFQGLRTLASSSNSDYYKLNADLDLQVTGVINVAQWQDARGWMPIGDKNIASEYFSGHVDGDNHTVTDLVVNSGTFNVGMFGRIDNNASISNLTLSNVSISNGANTAGALVGAVQTNATIDNVHVIGGTVDSAQNYAGGLIGFVVTAVEITNSSVSDLTITSTTSTAGGLIGRGAISTITDSFVSNTTIDGANQRAGGLIGDATNTTNINRSYATGMDITAGDYTGGLVGLASAATLSITNSFSDGTLTASAGRIGGIAGAFDASSSGTLNNVYSNADIQLTNGGTITAGGIVGLAERTTISEAYFGGDITLTGGGSHNIGTIAGAGGSSADVITVDSVNWNSDTQAGTTVVGSAPTGTTITNSTGIAAAGLNNEANYNQLDFSSTWDIIEGETTPYLKVVFTGLTGSVANDDTVAVAINGATQSVPSSLNQLTGADSTYWALVPTLSDNDVVTTYINDETNNAVAVYVADGNESRVSSMNLTNNTVTVSGASGKTVSNSTLASGRVSADPDDMLYTVSGNNVTFTSGVDFSTPGAYTISGDMNTGTGNQTYTGAVTLSADNELSGGTISFGSTLDGGQALTITGIGDFNGVVGGITPLSSLSVSSTSTVDTDVTTSGTQTYTGAMTLGGNVVLSASDFTLTGGIDGTSVNTYNLTLTDTSGDFTAPLSSVTNIGDFAANAAGSGAILNLSGSFSSDSTQTYSGAGGIELTGATNFTGSTVTFDSAVDGAQALVITGNADLNGVMGGTTALSSLSISGTSDLGADVTTTGNQTYTGAATLSADNELTGGTINFISTVNGAQALTITGNADIDGIIGGSTALTGLSISGASNIANNVTVNNTGTLTLTGATTLSGNATLTANNFSLNNIDGGDTYDLSIVRSGGSSSDTTTFNLSQFDNIVNFIATAQAGTLKLSATGGTINFTTAGTQTYTAGSAVQLAGDATFTAGGAGTTFNSVLESANSARSLIMNGDVIFKNTVGTTGFGLRALTINNAATLFNNITTQQTQDFNDTVTLAGNVTLTNNTSGSDINLTNIATTGGARALTINGQGGAIVSGTTTGLGNVNITANSLSFTNTLNSAGTIALNITSYYTGGVSTPGNLSFGGQNGAALTGNAGGSVQVLSGSSGTFTFNGKTVFTNAKTSPEADPGRVQFTTDFEVNVNQPDGTTDSVFDNSLESDADAISEILDSDEGSGDGLLDELNGHHEEQENGNGNDDEDEKESSNGNGANDK